MAERYSNSPSRWWRLDAVFKRFSLATCDHCSEKHLLDRPVCLKDSYAKQKAATNEVVVFSSNPKRETISS
jgi:hypothetical protein